MNANQIENIYPLSPMQEGMLFHSLYAPESGTYFEQTCWLIEGELDLIAFRDAWQKVLDRHSALRTAFAWEGLDEPLQIVYRHVRLPFDQRDWRAVPAAEREAHLEALLAAERKQGFDLATVPLLNLTLIQIGEQSHYFVWSHHHLLLDGWSEPIIVQDVFLAYEAICRGEAVSLPPATPFADYIGWLQQQDMEKAETFWRAKLHGFTEPTALLSGGPLTSQVAEEAAFASERVQLSEDKTANLQAYAHDLRVTLNTIVQAVWAILLNRYSGEDDVLFGATVAGRPPELAGIENIVGLFINTLPTRLLIDPTISVTDFIMYVHRQLLELREFEYCPLVEVKRWSELEPETDLFESLLVFENYPVEDAMQKAVTADTLSVMPVAAHTRTNYPLTIVFSPAKRLGVELVYHADVVDAGFARQLLVHVEAILSAILSDPAQPLAEVPLLTAVERRTLLEDWNDTSADFASERCAHELFEIQADQTPDALALLFEDEQLSYEELDRRANQLAHYLQRLGVGPEKLVAIALERSPEMIISLLAVLKAGGAYVPIDPTYPPERLAFMLSDSGAMLLISRADLVEELPLPENLPVTALDREWHAISRLSAERPCSGATAGSLAYIIYTSGSSGRPKGTMLAHRGLCNLVAACRRDFGLRPGKRFLQFFTFSFDGSVLEIFGALLSGAALVLARRETLLPGPELVRLLRNVQVSHVIMPPSALAALPENDLPDLEVVISGGESCTRDIVERWAPGRRFFNAYGPTEATVACTWYEVRQDALKSASIPIGRPVANTTLYVVDRLLRPVPVGVPGELLIGGVGVARGYLNRPELNAERYIADPFSSDPSSRLYRSGDLVRYRSDGNIEFLGRLDHQVKLRGFRIELDEIEVQLQEYEHIAQAVVLVVEQGAEQRQLAAYIVPTGDETVDVAALRAWLGTRMPDYMIPTAYVVLPAMPLTPSGKIDRKALPLPGEEDLFSSSSFAAPRTPTEEILAGLYAQSLGAGTVGIHDNFFELGGHSLLATRLVSRIQETFGAQLPLRDFFESRSVAAVASLLERTDGRSVEPIKPIPRDGALPLSYAQQRLWFLDQLTPGNLAYNIPLAVRLSGELDVVALQRSINQIVQRHEPLRSTFAEEHGRPVLEVAPELHVDLPCTDLRGLPEPQREQRAEALLGAEARRPFDLTTGPLLRVGLLQLAETEYILHVTMHHIVSDGWSMGIFVEEIAALYGSYSNGDAPPLPELPVQYADFAHWQQQQLQGDTLAAQLDYWREQLDGSPPILDLPTDRPRAALQTSAGATEDFLLSRDTVTALQALSRKEGVTLFMTLMAAFQTLLYRYSGQTDINVGTPIANRTRTEIERLIGFFVNTLVIRTDFADDPTFEELLARVRETALGAYAHQDLPFEYVVEALQPQRDMSHTPLFQVMFVLQNMLVEPIELPGLTLSSVETSRETATFDLTLTVQVLEDGLAGSIEYNTHLFERGTIQRMIGHLETLLNGIIERPDLPVGVLPLLTAAEKQRMLFDWNDTQVPFPDNSTIHALIEAQVDAQPAAPAVVFEDKMLSYGELDHHANQLAHFLQKQNVGPGQLVGIATERSLETMIGIYGVLKAGAAYLPLDPSYPAERLAFMLADSEAALVLTQARLVDQLAIPAGTAVVRLDADWPTIAQEPDARPAAAATAGDLAYVIYTSGSTGKPKGTMLRHRGICNLADLQRRAFRIRAGESRVLQFSPLSFDASVWEMFMALRNGATLVMAPQETLATGDELVQLLREKHVTNVTLPPSVLAVLPQDELPELETVISAGEACPAELVQRWASGRDFFNAYGPTETTVCASMYLCAAEEQEDPPIGKANDNFQLYVLDGHMQPLPIGVPGELYIGGVGLAQGYLNRPELTAEKFIPNPFSDDPTARLYRTGDLVKYRADGTLDFLGRIDQQVKVRGFRIELGEVETALSAFPGLQMVAVVAHEEATGDSRLVGYVVPESSPGPSANELRQFLRQKLPEYMVPSQFITLQAMPLSPSGKVDRRALPAPDRAQLELVQEYVAPRNASEEQLAQICADLLGLPRVGVHDNFFDLGGHSLLATQFVSRLRETFQIELPLRILFENPTVADLAAAVDREREKGALTRRPEIKRVSRERYRVSRGAVAAASGGELTNRESEGSSREGNGQRS